MPPPSSDFIPVYTPWLGEAEEANLVRCIREGWVSSIGPFVRRFEAEFARFVGARRAVAVSNGTAALHLPLHALGIGEDDEVIVPDLTFVSTANAVRYTGARVVLADVDPRTFNLSVEQVARRITWRTRAVVPVHLYGNPAALGPLKELCDRRGVPIVEDAAEAHGAVWGERRVGSWGKAGAFSFFGNKILTTGEGGMVLTDDEALADRMEFLRGHGMAEGDGYFHPEIGFNYRMTSLQAAVGCAQLDRIAEILDRKRRIEAWYRESLAGLAGVSFQEAEPEGSSVHWMHSVVLDPRHGLDRVRRTLRESGIDTRPFFTPLHRLPMYETKEAFPVSEALWKRGMNLPSSPLLERAQVDRVCEVLKRALKEAG